jgi:hypothetical protein
MGFALIFSIAMPLSLFFSVYENSGQLSIEAALGRYGFFMIDLRMGLNWRGDKGAVICALFVAVLA